MVVALEFKWVSCELTRGMQAHVSTAQLTGARGKTHLREREAWVCS
jgi:hypothetical protein